MRNERESERETESGGGQSHFVRWIEGCLAPVPKLVVGDWWLVISD